MVSLADLMSMWGGSGDRTGMTSNLVWNGGGDAENRSGQLLDLARKYDPNARIGEAGDLRFDRSLLPKPVLDTAKFDRGGSGNVWDAYQLVDSAGTAHGGAEIKDRSKIIHDPNYGDFVGLNNLNTAPGDSDSGFFGQLGKYAPAAISAIMAMGAGLPIAGVVQGLGAADQGGFSGSSITNLLRIIGGSIANSYIPGAGAAINLATGAMNRGN